MSIIREPPYKAISEILPKQMLAWLRDVTDLLNKNEGKDYTLVDNTGKTVTVVNGEITNVV